MSDFYYLIIIALIWFTPYAAQPLLTAALARLAYVLSRRKRRAIEINLDAFQPALTTHARTNIVRGTFYAFWEEMFEWSLPATERAAADGIQLVGSEHLHAALAAGHGAILWDSNGFGKRLLAKRILHAHGFVLEQVHGARNLGGFLIERPTSNPIRRSIQHFFSTREARLIRQTHSLPADPSLAFTRTLLAALQHNALLCVAGDGRMGHKFTRLPFLGQHVPFATGMVSLAQMAGAPILPLFCFRPTHAAPVVIVEPPLAPDTALVHYAQLLQSRIRAHPEQYRNWHLLQETEP